MARKRYRAWPQGQAVLFPRSPQDWLPDDHPVRFVLDVVEMLDLSAIEEVIQSKDARGECPYDPRVKVALLINACCTGICSSRKIARATYEQVAFRVLSEGQHPYFTNVNAFRRRHLVAFRELFWQLLCQQAGLVKQGHVALDGTKLQGNASKHEAMSFARMKKLEAEIGGLLFRVDEEEDARLGRGRDASDIPAELRRREARLAKLRAVKVALESEARAARRQHERELAGGCGQRARSAQTDRQRRLSATPAERHRAAADGFANPSLQHRRRPAETPAQDRARRPPKGHARRNFTDPESRVMQSGGPFVQGDDAQAMLHEANQAIVAASVTHQPPNAGLLEPRLQLAVEHLGAAPDALRRPRILASERRGRQPCRRDRSQRRAGVHPARRGPPSRRRTGPRFPDTQPAEALPSQDSPGSHRVGICRGRRTTRRRRRRPEPALS